jgi:hypothetical protein
VFFAAVSCASAVLAALALWIFAHARTPFDYMVVGTLAATIVIAVVFVVIALRTARRSERSL